MQTCGRVTHIIRLATWDLVRVFRVSYPFTTGSTHRENRGPRILIVDAAEPQRKLWFQFCLLFLLFLLFSVVYRGPRLVGHETCQADVRVTKGVKPRHLLNVL